MDEEGNKGRTREGRNEGEQVKLRKYGQIEESKGGRREDRGWVEVSKEVEGRKEYRKGKKNGKTGGWQEEKDGR